MSLPTNQPPTRSVETSNIMRLKDAVMSTIRAKRKKTPDSASKRKTADIIRRRLDPLFIDDIALPIVVL